MRFPTDASMRVLLVEDDHALSQVLTEFLMGEGMTVVAVADRAEARRLAKEGGWDVCIADCSPYSTGEPSSEDRVLFAALSSVAPLIVASGRAWTRDTSASDMGVAAILPKPFDLEALLEELLAARNLVGAGRVAIERM